MTECLQDCVTHGPQTRAVCERCGNFSCQSCLNDAKLCKACVDAEFERTWLDDFTQPSRLGSAGSWSALLGAGFFLMVIYNHVLEAYQKYQVRPLTKSFYAQISIISVGSLTVLYLCFLAGLFGGVRRQ